MHYLLLFFLLTYGQWILAQQVVFEETYGLSSNDYNPWDIIELTDGSLITTAKEFSQNLDELYLLKTDAQGNQIWTKTIVSPSGRAIGGNAITLEGSGDIIVAFNYFLNMGNDYGLYFTRIDTAGNTIDSTTFIANGYAYGAGGILPDGNGGFLLMGTRRNTVTDLRSLMLMRLDADFNVSWEKHYFQNTDTRVTYMHDFIRTKSGEYVLCFGHQNDNDFSVPYLMLANANGDSLRTILLETDTTNDIEFTGVVETIDGGFAVAGYEYLDQGDSSFLKMKKFDVNGNELWTKRYFKDDGIEGYDLTELADGGLVACGIIASNNLADFNAYLLRTDGSGNEIWDTAFNYADSEFSRIKTLNNGDFVSTGYYETLSANYALVNIRMRDTTINTSIAEAMWRNTVTYPNPVTNVLHVRLDQPVTGRMYLSNLLGQVEQVTDLNEQDAVSWPVDTPPGIYLLTVTSQQGMYSLKILVQ